MALLKKITIVCPHCNWEKSWKEGETTTFHVMKKWQNYKYCPQCNEYTLAENDIYNPTPKQKWFQKVFGA